MDDHDRWCAVDHCPFFPACLVDHPVVPTGATDGEIGNIQKTGKRKEEEVTAGRTMESALAMDYGR